MADSSKKSSSKATRKHAGIQRGIGNKSARELQEEAAAIKAQTFAKRHAQLHVPQSAKATGGNATTSIPDYLSDACSSDCSPPTPELVPASPSGLSSGISELDEAASCASSTSQDERPAASKSNGGQEQILDDLDQLLQHSQEALIPPSTALEATHISTICADTTIDPQAAELPAATWKLSPEAQAHVEAEEGCICAGVWTFECPHDMALWAASLAELLPVPTAMEDDATKTCSERMLKLLLCTTRVAAADAADVTLPFPDLHTFEAQVFAEADEMCSGPNLWICDFNTATLAANTTELRPSRAINAADASGRVPVSSLVAQQAHAATATNKEAAQQGGLVLELSGEEQQPDAHNAKGLPSGQGHNTAPPAAPSCSCPAALALHACSHLQAACAHRWMKPRALACIRLPVQLVAVAGVEATAFTGAVCHYAMLLAR